MTEHQGDHDTPQGRNEPSRKNLLFMTGGAAAAAAIILFGAVLPAEYNIDPLGVGKASGLSRLWSPPEVEYTPGAGERPLFTDHDIPFRTDVLEIPLLTEEDPERRYQVEYKVRMKEGATLVYGWEAIGAPPDEFYFDFHSHTTPEPGAEMVVASHKAAIGAAQNGAIVAPFDGIHGWYLQNQSLEPVTVRVRLAGFYELIPAGEDGNEAGLVPLPAR